MNAGTFIMSFMEQEAAFSYHQAPIFSYIISMGAGE